MLLWGPSNILKKYFFGPSGQLLFHYWKEQISASVGLTVITISYEEAMKTLVTAITLGLFSSVAMAQAAPAKPAAAPAAAAPAKAAAVDCKDVKNKDKAECKKK